MTQAKINECINLVRVGNRKINEIRIGENESSKHRDKKIEVCTELIKQGKSFITEAIFKIGGRADILVLDDFRVIEIMHSEKEFSITEKRKQYPIDLRLEVIKV